MYYSLTGSANLLMYPLWYSLEVDEVLLYCCCSYHQPGHPNVKSDQKQEFARTWWISSQYTPCPEGDTMYDIRQE
jgi:hypothetical protein